MALCRSYKRTSKQLFRDCYNVSHPKRRKEDKACRGELKTIAGLLVRELERKLVPEEFGTELELSKSVLTQMKNSKDRFTVYMDMRFCIY